MPRAGNKTIAIGLTLAMAVALAGPATAASGPALDPEALPPHVSPRAAQRLLELDSSLRVGANGRLLYVDEGKAHDEPASTSDGPTTAEISSAVDDVASGDVFALHSRPGADRVLFMDLDGATVTGTAWNEGGPASITAAPFDIEGDPGTVTATEERYIAELWLRVSEAFSPWDVDVTTEQPSEAELVRSSAGDEQFGVSIVVTDDNTAQSDVCGSCGGVAYVDVYDYANNSYYMPSWSFQGGSPAYTAAVVAHEVGHNLGLSHDGLGAQGYHPGDDIWSPVMGAGYTELTQWSNGDYSGSTQTEDDLGIIGTNVPLVTDAHGDSTGAATAVRDESFAVDGRITPGDSDVFRFDVDDGDLELTVDVAVEGATLDARLVVTDDDATVLADVDPDAAGGSDYDGYFSYTNSGMGASATLTLTAGTYFATVTQGNRDDLYSTYGSVGTFTLRGTQVAPDTVPPLAPRVVNVNVLTGGDTRVFWPRVSGADDYVVRVRTYANGGWSAWSAVGTVLDPDRELVHTPSDGQKVQYRVRARNGAGASVWTRSDPVYLVPPPAPSVLNVDLDGAGTAHVFWPRVKAADDYVVRVRTYANGGWSRWSTVEIVAAPDRELYDTPPNAEKVQYVIRARNDAGRSSWVKSSVTLR